MLSPVSTLVVVILAVMGGGIGFPMWVLSCGVGVQVRFVGGGIEY